MNPLVIELYHHLRDCWQIPMTSGHKEKIASVPGHLPLLHLSSEKMQAVLSTIKSRLSCPFMYPTLVLKVQSCDKMMKMLWLNRFSSIQHDGAKNTQFVFNGIRLWVDSPFCHVVTEIVSYVKKWMFLPTSGDGEC